MTPEALLPHLSRLPPAPKVAAALLADLDRKDSDAAGMARLIAADQALSVKLLTLANSAFYRKSRQIASVQDAAVLVGTEALRALALGLSAAASLPFPPGYDRRMFWRYNLHTAVAARQLAPRVGVDAGLAFSAGLLHTLGEPLIGLAFPEQARQLDREVAFFERGRAAAERRVLGLDYAEVGAWAGEHLSLPGELIYAIAHCAEPLAVQPFLPLAGLVRLSAGLAMCRELDLSLSEQVAGPDGALLERLNLTLRGVLELPPLDQLAAGLESLVL